MLYRLIPWVVRQIGAREGVTPGAEPPSQVRPWTGFRGCLFEAAAQLVQERRPLAVGDHLELGGDCGVHELSPASGFGSARTWRRGEGSLNLLWQVHGAHRNFPLRVWWG